MSMVQVPSGRVPESGAPSGEGKVVVAVKTPTMARATTVLLPRELTLAQALAEIRSTAPRDVNAARVLQQLALETSAETFDFLVVTETGEITTVTPATTLQEIAVPREVWTPAGPKVVATAAFEVQAYAPVGVS